MRRLIGVVLFAVGGFLLIAGLMALLWVPGAAKKTPLDTDSTTLLSGEAAKFDATTGAFEPRPVYAISINETAADSSTDDVVVFAQTQCATFVPVVACLDYDDPDNLSGPDVTTFATDRTSAEGIPWKDLPDGVLKDLESTKEPAVPVEVEGLVNKWPFDAEKKDYAYWEGTLDRAVDAVYDRTEDVEGVETYVYRIVSEREPIEVAPGIPGTYSSTKEIYVEPQTGSIIKQTDDQQRWLEDGTQALDLQLAFTDDEVKQKADEAKDNIDRLQLYTRTVPLIGLIGGPIALIVGLFLIWRRRRSDADADVEADTPDRPLAEV